MNSLKYPSREPSGRTSRLRALANLYVYRDSPYTTSEMSCLRAMTTRTMLSPLASSELMSGSLVTSRSAMWSENGRSVVSSRSKSCRAWLNWGRKRLRLADVPLRSGAMSRYSCMNRVNESRARTWAASVSLNTLVAATPRSMAWATRAPSPWAACVSSVIRVPSSVLSMPRNRVSTPDTKPSTSSEVPVERSVEPLTRNGPWSPPAPDRSTYFSPNSVFGRTVAATSAGTCVPWLRASVMRTFRFTRSMWRTLPTVTPRYLTSLPSCSACPARGKIPETR